MNNDKSKLSKVELIKEKSNFLRGTISQSLEDSITGSIAPDDTQLIKFHGSYQQYDRDLDSERKKQKLEPLYQFMVRVRMPGGIASANQWKVIDELADKYGSRTIKLTTRQTFQLHGILKPNLKNSIRDINNSLLDTIAACGDVNRNVMLNPIAEQSGIHEKVYSIAVNLSEHFLPRTTAYHEIWLDKKNVAGKEENEPVYGKTYLPRKFKTAFAIPPYNDVDVFANDLGFIAIVEKGALIGFNVCIGGGMGMTFGNTDTYPRLADLIGFCSCDQVVPVAEAIVKFQRENGNREDRQNARFKYTVDLLGIEFVKKNIEERINNKLQAPKKYTFTKSGDSYGWLKGTNKRWYFTLFVEGGRIRDAGISKLKTFLRMLAEMNICDFRLTGNQNLVLGNISDNNKKIVESLLVEYRLNDSNTLSGLRKNSIACVALNTCSLAFAEAERYLPSLIDKIDALLILYNLEKEEILIRMTGCPNGCGRPYLGEIGFVGRAPGLYNMYLGAGFAGERLNKLYKEMLNESQILFELDQILSEYAAGREENERFGDFVIRKKIVKATNHGKDFHD